MATHTKSVFLYGKPTERKQTLLYNTQKIYTDLINTYIDILVQNPSYYLDLFNNNKKASIIRNLEKTTRKSNKTFSTLGSAYGQNAIDHAVKECHNHFTRIKNKLYGYCMNKRNELVPYVESIALLNASILDSDETQTLQLLIQNEQAKEKPSQSKIDFYQGLLKHVQSLTVDLRNEYKNEVCSMFYETLESRKIPFVNKVPLQLDSRLYKIEKAKHVQSDFVLSCKVFGEKDYIHIPISTSKNGIRRLRQYNNGSPTITFQNGKFKVSIPFEKKIIEKKSKTIVGIDVGITDLLFSSENKRYGSFTGMITFYEQVLEPKLKKRSSLRKVMKRYQKELRKSSTDDERKKWLREKIFNIAASLNGKNSLEKCKRQYAHEVDARLNSAVKSFIEDVKKQKNVSVSLESLDITEHDRGKQSNKRDSSWARGKLSTKVKELLTWNGIPFVEVDPAYTSKACPTCHNIDNENRKFKHFVCTVCKHTADSDHNASINIKMRATDKEIKEIVDKYSYNTKKRHTAIKKLYAERHEFWLTKNTVVAV